MINLKVKCNLLTSITDEKLNPRDLWISVKILMENIDRILEK